MLARLRVLLSFRLSIPNGSQLKTQEYDLPPYRVRILPPCLAAIDPISITKMALVDIAHSIIPAPEQTPGNVMVDGKPAVQANLFQVDFIKSSFDRRRFSIENMPVTPLLPLSPLDFGDPSITAAFEVVNNWINRYKYLVRSSNVRPVRPNETPWVLEYLADNEERLPQDPTLFRLRTFVRQRVPFDLLDAAVWDRVGAVPIEAKALAWEVLLLDAPALLPEIGPAIVLAYAALEAFIDWCLDKLAPLAKIPPALWKWISERDSFYLRPRTAEQFDVLLESLTGKSLKAEGKLWELFRNLGAARHSYVHTGHAEIGNDAVTLERATELVSGAARVIAWVEALLPKELQRPQLEAPHTIAITHTIPVAVVAVAPVPGREPQQT